MDEPDRGGRRQPDVFVSQLRYFDGMVLDLRGFYDSFTPEEKLQFRFWLERVLALQQECPWSAFLQVKVEYDLYDEKGEMVDFAGADFSPNTMLAAIKAWDAGEDFAPQTILP